MTTHLNLTVDRIRKSVVAFGGKFVAGTTTYNGVEYDYATEWRKVKDAQDFLNTISPHVSKSQEDGNPPSLMLFFSVK